VRVPSGILSAISGSIGATCQLQVLSSKTRMPMRSPAFTPGRSAAIRWTSRRAAATAFGHRLSAHMLPERSRTSASRCGVGWIVTVFVALALRNPTVGHALSNQTSSVTSMLVSA
jgi:hypothetical protein